MPDTLRDALPLIGYMDEQSARNFLTNDCVLDKSSEEISALTSRCRDVALRRGTPDLQAKTRSLAEPAALISQIGRDERLPQVVKGWKWSFAEVGIDKLLTTQRYIDTEYAEAISHKLDLGTGEGRVRFCLTD